VNRPQNPHGVIVVDVPSIAVHEVIALDLET